ncbi:hypothetical protein BDZ97DRAFT_956392 [Flammula alnicola]|nr:hypothetical protein BDZ97DRAFT_956392 [Flammula alnicola]
MRRSGDELSRASDMELNLAFDQSIPPPNQPSSDVLLYIFVHALFIGRHVICIVLLYYSHSVTPSADLIDQRCGCLINIRRCDPLLSDIHLSDIHLSDIRLPPSLHLSSISHLYLNHLFTCHISFLSSCSLVPSLSPSSYYSTFLFPRPYRGPCRLRMVRSTAA